MAEELNNGIEPVEQDNTKLYIGMRKKADGFLMAATDEEYDRLNKREWDFMGVVIRNEEEEVDILVHPSQMSCFFGDGPADIPASDKRRKHYTNPTMTALDGQWRTQFLLSEQGVEHSDNCALCYCRHEGMWLGSGGEMSLVSKYREEVDSLMAIAGGTPMSDDKYWLSTQYSKEYSWFVDMTDGTFGFWISKTRNMLVRPVGDASGYQATVTNG